MKRSTGVAALFLLYATLCYAALAGTLLLAVLFLGNFGDSFGPIRLLGRATPTPAGRALAIDLALVALFGLQHSVMARPDFKRLTARWLPAPIERSTYVLLSCLLLALTFWQWRSIGGVIWQVETPSLRMLLQATAVAGGVLAVGGSFAIDHFALFGLRQAWLHLRGKPPAAERMSTPGPYRWVRHPLYTGWLLAVWAAPTMTTTRLIFALLTTGYLLVGVRLEERDLTRRHAGYAAYRRRVPMLFPHPWSEGSRRMRAGGPRA